MHGANAGFPPLYTRIPYQEAGDWLMMPTKTRCAGDHAITPSTVAGAVAASDAATMLAVALSVSILLATEERCLVPEAPGALP